MPLDIVDPQTAFDGEPAALDARLTQLERMRQPVWIYDMDRRRIHWCNTAGLAIWSATSLAELLARDHNAKMSPSVARRLQQFREDFERTDARFFETWTIYPRGVPRTVRVVFSGFRLADGRLAMFCEVLGEHRGDSETLRSAEALTHTSVMITLVDRHGRALYRNPAAREAAAAPQSSVRTRFPDRLQRRALLTQLHKEGQAKQVMRVVTAQGERWHEVSARRCSDAVTGTVAWLVSEMDVSDLKRTEARADHLAHHDMLTGLPNRNFVLRNFQDRLDDLRTRGEEAALVFVDLDHFKHINDSLGHGAGDALLVTVAQRLRSAVREIDLVARLGGDEFLVLAGARDIEAHAEGLCARLLESLLHPVRMHGTALRVTPSIGVCIAPRDGDDIDTLMRHADLAMYRAKDEGRARVARFTPDMTTRAQRRRQLEDELHVAIEQRQFDVFFQPRLDVASNRVVGAEALVRWRHPVRGLVLPGEFVPLLEECGLIGPLGLLVMEQACRQQAAWQARGVELRVSVNLSPRQFEDPGLLDAMARIVAATGCDPRRIELEITESLLVGNDRDTVALLEGLCAMGFRIAIDDFGTGYSNLAYLQRYPIDCLKIDRSFVGALDTGMPIAQLIITMCRMLGVEVVAEGVETASQLQWLRSHGCDEYQGFLCSPAVPSQEFDRLLARPAPRASISTTPRSMATTP